MRCLAFMSLERFLPRVGLFLAKIWRKTIPFHRAALQFFAVSANEIKRLQFTIHSHNVQALKWAERCYLNMREPW